MVATLLQAKLQSVVPVIPASDMTASIEFYAKLGFITAFNYGDYVIIRRDEVEVHLFINDDSHLAEWTSFRVKVTNVDALYHEFKNGGIECKLETKPWGTRDLSLIDPTGVLITFQE